MGTSTEVKKIVVKNKSNEKVAPAKCEKPLDANIFAQRVEKKAYELFEQRGCQSGHDWDDWLEAERIVEQEMIAGK